MNESDAKAYIEALVRITPKCPWPRLLLTEDELKYSCARGTGFVYLEYGKAKP